MHNNTNKIKAFFKCPEEFKNRFANSSCLLTVSVGQATHEDEMFAVTIDLVNKSFSSCAFLLGDSLQRHNMAFSSTKDANFFYDIAVKEGDLWLERNRKYFNRLTIPYKIYRWDKWLNHTDFHNQLEKIRATINSDPVYKAVFDNIVEVFLKKYRDRLSNPENFNWERASKLSHDYVVEECAALCLWPESQCNFEAYPIGHNPALKATRERFVLPHYPDLLQEITIKFKNVKLMKPQRFVTLTTE